MSLLGLADATWRVLLMFYFVGAPWAAPVEVIAASNTFVALIRITIFCAVYGLAILGVRRASLRWPGLAALAVLTLLAAPIAAAAATGGRGPLASGVWILGPLAWATLALVAAGPATSRLESPRGRNAIGAMVVVIGIADLCAVRQRIGSRESLWREALTIDPGNEDAALAVATTEDRARAAEVLLACARVHAASCRCAEGAASFLVDLGRFGDALGTFDASDACPRSPRRVALRAEALLGTGDLVQGTREAEMAYARAPNDAHACYARAWAAMLAGRVSAALPDAERAAGLDRGVPAYLLYGMLLYDANDLAGADRQFSRALALDSTNARATYDHALVAQRQGRYHDAREGYLRTLQLDQREADARYNLVVLTHGRGADMEARYHLEQFAKSFPGDARVDALRQIVASPPARPAMTLQ